MCYKYEKSSIGSCGQILSPQKEVLFKIVAEPQKTGSLADGGESGR